MIEPEKIEEMRNRASDIIADLDNPGLFGMTYEQGVEAALSWVLEEDEEPIEEE